MKKTKLTIKEMLICKKCDNLATYCDKCNIELCIELGEKTDCYCNKGEHYCIDCIINK